MLCPFPAASGSRIKSISDWGELEGIINGSGGNLVVLEFYANWCSPCRAIDHAFEQVAEANPTVVFLKVDVSDPNLMDTIEANNISALPTFLFFKYGYKVAEMVGPSKRKLEHQIAMLKRE